MPRTKGDVRQRLREAALQLYLERGYDQTTTAEIAARADVTERTFFRYFPDKREVLFDETKLHTQLNIAIAAAPADLPPMDTLLWAFQSLAPIFEANRKLAEPGRILIAQTPALYERHLAKAASTILAVAGALERRDVSPGTARLVAATGMAVVGCALENWFTDPASDIGDQLARAFQNLRDLSADHPRQS